MSNPEIPDLAASNPAMSNSTMSSVAAPNPATSAPASSSPTAPTPALLSSVRVIESSLLGPGLLSTFLSDMGAEVIKVEPPQGDYIRQMTWPIIGDESLLHLHTHRGKKSIVLDLKKPEAVEIYIDLVRHADAVVEAMRPGALERRGLGFERLCEINPRIVFCTISGYGMTGPYKDMPSHGIAYDTWAGLLPPVTDEEGFCRIPPDFPNIGINVGPMIGALGVMAGIVRARATGEPARMEIAQSDAAAYMDWYRIETWRAYERPEAEVTGNPSDNYERRPPGLAGMWGGVRYQIYESSDGHVLFMASEQAFWKNFCEGVERMDLFERWPGATYADHARNNTELQEILRGIFRQRTSAEWLEFGDRVNTPIAPVNTPKNVADDPQFQARLPWLPESQLGADQLPLPLKVVGEELPSPTRAPTVGRDTEDVLTRVLGYDGSRLDELRSGGVIN